MVFHFFSRIVSKQLVHSLAMKPWIVQKTKEFPLVSSEIQRSQLFAISTLSQRFSSKVKRKKRTRASNYNSGDPLKFATLISSALDIDEEELENDELTMGLNAVVKVYCKHTEPNFSLPWQRKRQVSSNSSGFMVSQGSNRWVLTNAHSVAYYSQVQVKRRDNDRKFIARVLAMGTDCDIALLSVEENEFWDGIVPLSLGPLPHLQDYVTVVGYPIGGDTISVTSGVVSRIEVTQYSHSSLELLGVQIDAAINSGNSGGPVFNENGVCVGIAFQSFAGSDVENIGYVIPTPVIQHFLEDYHMNKNFSGFPSLGFVWQSMESEDLRKAFKMQPEDRGVLIRTINPTGSAAGLLEPGDVFVSFDGIELANDGTVPFRLSERISFTYLVSQKHIGDFANITVLREGIRKEFNIKLIRSEQLVPVHLDNGNPSYFVIAGFVFTNLIEPYLESEYGSDYMTDSPVKLLHKMYFGMPKDKGQQVVLLAQVLASECTEGYEDVDNIQVLKFNGTAIENLKHLVEMVASCTDDYMRFDLDYDQVVIISSDKAKKSTSKILIEHAIPDVASPDIIEYLKEKNISISIET